MPTMRIVLVLTLVATFSVTAAKAPAPPINGAECALMPLNADTFGNIGVVIPNGATVTGAGLFVRIQNPPDNYSDCSNPNPANGLCPSPHGDIALVQRWDVPDEGGTRGLGAVMYNAKNAPTKYVRLCYSYTISTEQNMKPLGQDFLNLPAFDLSKKYHYKEKR